MLKLKLHCFCTLQNFGLHTWNFRFWEVCNVGSIFERRNHVDQDLFAGKFNIISVNGHISKENYYFELKITILEYIA